MARRKKGQPINGWLILDKPLGITSTHALARVKRIFDAQKAGHAGTLDPLATGILPIAFGEATKTVSFAVDGAKSYAFAVRWGAETTTDDKEGAVTRTSDARPTEGDIRALLPRFIGEIMQTPPAFSAVKIDGERAYDLARDGETVVLEPRPIQIDDLRLIDMPTTDTAIFEADCGKGTYVRAIARDMGRAFGCYGHVVELRRTRVGPFEEGDAWGLDELADEAEAGRLFDTDGPLLPVEMPLRGMPELMVTPSDASKLVRGMAVLIRGRDAPVLSGLMYATCQGRIVALGEVEKGALHPIRDFNLG